MKETRFDFRFAEAALLIILFVFATCQSAIAIPALQIYIEGSTYDLGTDTWVIETDGSFNIWVLGDVDHYGIIEDVKLSAAVASDEIPGGSISLAPGTTSLLTDPSTPADPTATDNFPSDDGERPVMGDGTPLAWHDIFGEGTSFFEWDLGDFYLTDSPIGDFNGDFPWPSTFPDDGQINFYTVSVEGFSTVHFDAYDHYLLNEKHAKYDFAPFSHDGETVPEPETLLLLGLGLALLGLIGRKSFKKS